MTWNPGTLPRQQQSLPRASLSCCSHPGLILALGSEGEALGPESSVSYPARATCVRQPTVAIVRPFAGCHLSTGLEEHQAELQTVRDPQPWPLVCDVLPCWSKGPASAETELGAGQELLGGEGRETGGWKPGRSSWRLAQMHLLTHMSTVRVALVPQRGRSVQEKVLPVGAVCTVCSMPQG